MKMITFEVSDRSLAATMVTLSNEQWNCSVVVSQLHSGQEEVFNRSEHISFSGLHDPESALDLARAFTSSYIEKCFPEPAEAA